MGKHCPPHMGRASNSWRLFLACGQVKGFLLVESNYFFWAFLGTAPTLWTLINYTPETSVTENIVQHFMLMSMNECGTLSQMCGKWSWSCCASRMPKVQFLVFCFWLCFVALQVTMFNVVFQWSNFGESVSMMEWNPCYSIDNLYKECESWFLEMIGAKLLRERKDVDEEKLYEAS
jgi:hypothetical protein